MILFACVALGGFLLFWGLPKLWVIVERSLRRG